RLDARGDEGVALAGLDRVVGHPDRLQRRRAEAVDGRPRDGVGQPGEQRRAAAEVHALLLLREPQPTITSTISSRGSPGTLARAASIANAHRSSGRASTSEPLCARPIGVRAVETI